MRTKRVNKRRVPAIPPNGPPINARLTSGLDKIVDVVDDILVSFSCCLVIGALDPENTSELSVIGDRVDKKFE